MKCEKHEALFLEAKSRLINNLPPKMMLQSCNNFPARLANSLYETLGLLSLFLRKETKAVTLAFGRDTIFQSKSCLRLRVTQRGSGRETRPCVVESLRWSAKAKDLFGKEFGGKPKNINVGESHILTTIAVGGAPAEDTLIRSSLMRPKLSLKNLNNHPGKLLSRQCRAPVTGQEGGVDKDLILPHVGEERNLGRVKEHQAVAAGHVTFPHNDPPVWVQLSGL